MPILGLGIRPAIAASAGAAASADAAIASADTARTGHQVTGGVLQDQGPCDAQQ